MPQLGKNLLTLCQRLELDGPVCSRVRERFGYNEKPVHRQRKTKRRKKSRKNRIRIIEA